MIWRFLQQEETKIFLDMEWTISNDCYYNKSKSCILSLLKVIITLSTKSYSERPKKSSNSQQQQNPQQQQEALLDQGFIPVKKKSIPTQ